jgi:hypothetical protein
LLGANEGDVLIYVIPPYKKGEKEINPEGSLVGGRQGYYLASSRK